MANPYQAPAVEWAWVLDGTRSRLTPSLGPSMESLRDYRPPATGIVVALALAIAANAAAAVAHAQQRGVLATEANGEEVDVLLAEASQHFVLFADGAVALSIVGCAVFGALWLFRAAKNADVLAPGAMRSSPSWSVACFFVPFVNLIMPMRVMFELFSTSVASGRGDRDHDSDSGDAYAVVIAWWVVCLLAVFLRWQGSSVASAAEGNLGDALMAQELLASSSCVAVIAAVISLFIVRAINAGQHERLARG
jgi:hypothetical protein